ncbi:MAG TPA: hypothetical protein VMZ71_05870 [Gemmataceae bacterium]|nr:hypothetical protein [Gemmataceae bacterium]
MATRKLVVFTTLLAVVGLAGCGKVRQSADRTKASNALKALSLDYVGYQDANGKPPASAAELSAYWKKMGQSAMQSGELEKLTVVWGAKLGGAPVGNRVLASHPAVGGAVPVMMQDGSVKTMTESEFAAAPKAEAAKP